MSSMQSESRSVYKDNEMEPGGKRMREDKDVVHKVLLNPDILEIVFKHVDFFRLKLYRTVCKLWNKEICHRLRKRAVFWVQAEKDFSTLMRMLKKREQQELLIPQLIHSLSIQFRSNCMLEEALSAPLPISKIQIGEEMDCHHSTITSKLHTLILSCSSIFTYLKIPFCNMSAPESSAGTSLNLKFPLLEELHLTVLERNLFQDHPHVPQRDNFLIPGSPLKGNGALSFFSNLTSSAPKLYRQEIVLLFRNLSGPIKKVLEALTLHKMKSVNIWTIGTLDPTCKSLRQIQFEQLSSLSLNSRSSKALTIQYLLPTLESTCESLKSLSLSVYYTRMSPSVVCPALKTFSIRHFTFHAWDLGCCFPNVETVRIHKVHSELPRALQTCPASIKRVEIGFGQNLTEVKESLWSLYYFSSGSATAWELPFGYVEDFCDFIASHREGKGVKSLTIGFVHGRPRENCWPALAKGLEKTVNLRDLEELTLKRCGSDFCSSTWNSLSPQIFNKLCTFTYCSRMDLSELPELVGKLSLVKNVVLVGSGRGCFDMTVKQVFAALPNATVRSEGGQGIVEKKYQQN